MSQSDRDRWALHKHDKLTNLGYTRNPGDPSFYHRLDKHGIVLMGIIVDDFKITGWPPSAVAKAKHELDQLWDMTDLGPLKYFANIEINRSKSGKVTTLKQTNYIRDMLAKYGLADSYIKHTPCTTAIYNQRLLDPVTPHPPMFDNDYRNQLGTLSYLRRTRPDLCVGLGVCGQFAKMGRHGPQHYRALRNIMRFCLKTEKTGIVLRSSGKGYREPWIVTGHIDSDWANWKGSRRSRTGWLIFLNKMLIDFGSKLQPSVALSSAEAEYMALAFIIRRLLWLLNIIEAIPGHFVERPIKIYEDNKPCINLANQHAASKYTRHIGIAHHFVRDHCYSGDKQFDIVYRKGTHQRADGMTKPLPRGSFEAFAATVVSDYEC